MNYVIKQLEKQIVELEHQGMVNASFLEVDKVQALKDECIGASWGNGVGRCNYLLGLLYRSKGNIHESRKHFFLTIKDGTATTDTHLRARGAYGISLIAFQESNMTETYSFIKEAEHFARLSGDTFILCACGLHEAKIKIRYGEYDAALILLQAALRMSMKHDFKLTGEILQSIVELHLINGEFRQARHHAVTYLELYATTAERRLNALVSLIRIDVELDEFQRARELLAEVTRIANSKESVIFASILCLYGRIETKEKHEESAVNYLKQGIRLYHKFQRPKLESNAYILLGEAFLGANSPEEAIACGHKALKLAAQANDRYITKESLKLLYESYKKKLDIKESLIYLEKFNELSRQDEIKQFENRLAFVNLQTEYEKKMAEAEDERRRTEVLQVELERKERDLTERTQNLIRQTEAMSTLRKDLRAILKRTPATNPLVKQIADRLRVLPDTQLDNWNEFESHFSAVHPEFHQKLAEKFPSLTKMERKLCALLRLNLTTTDMAKLLILSERNIENHRYRLRKKLGVKGDTPLQDFLTTIG